MSDTNVTGAHNILKKIPWQVVLPLFMAAATTGLYYLDRAWLRTGSTWDDSAVSTAQGMAALINGPGSSITNGMKLFGQLLGVAIFWSWSGFLLDRRLNGTRTPIVQRTRVRIILYFIGLMLACWSVWSAARFFSPETFNYLSRLSRILLSSSPRRTLLGREFIAAAKIFWGSGYALYFSRKLLQFVANQ